MCGRFHFTTFLLVLLIITVSCSEDTPQDGNSGSVVITSPAVTDLLKKTVTIEAEITQSNFDHAEVYLGSTLIHESDQEIISFEYDTEQIEDGTHTLKVVATNNDGEEAEASVDIEILNTLLTFSIPENYLSGTQEIWHFITDYNGNLLGAQKGGNNETISFETPENYSKDQPFVLHQLIRRTKGTGGYLTTIQSYTDFRPGHYWHKQVATNSNPTGPYQLMANNVPVDYTRGSLNGLERYFGFSSSRSGNTITLQAELPNFNSNLLSYLYNHTDRGIVPKYKHIENVKSLQTTTVDFSEFTDMDQVTLTFDSQMDNVQLFLGVLNSDKSRNYSLDSYSKPNTSDVKVYYPGNTFSNYITNINTFKGNRTNYYSKVGGIPTTYKTLNANVSSITFTNGTLTVTSTGTFDNQYSYSLEDWTAGGATHTLSWYFYMDDEDIMEFKIPALPSAILDEYPELSSAVIDFNVAKLAEYDGFNGYQDYIRHLLQSDEYFYAEYTESTELVIAF